MRASFKIFRRFRLWKKDGKVVGENLHTHSTRASYYSLARIFVRWRVKHSFNLGFVLFTCTQIFKMESLLLRTLKFEMGAATSRRFAERFLRAADADEELTYLTFVCSLSLPLSLFLYLPLYISLSVWCVCVCVCVFLCFLALAHTGSLFFQPII